MSLPPGTTELIERALDEDLGSGDVTAEATVPAGLQGQAHLIQKEPGVIFGLDIAAEVFRRVGATEFDRTVIEGHWHESVPRDMALIHGPARAILAGERVALNFVGHLSGIATMTARFVDAVAGTGTKILDTRKTTPGMRWLEKAAVVAGGGRNHRMGLYDAFLIKENHVAVAGGIGEAVRRARASLPDHEVEIECRDAAEVQEALEAGADRLLLDNMDSAALTAAVDARDSAAARSSSRALLEASGGVTVENVAAIAETGVDYVSVGALTHSAPALDLSMLVDVQG